MSGIRKYTYYTHIFSAYGLKGDPARTPIVQLGLTQRECARTATHLLPLSQIIVLSDYCCGVDSVFCVTIGRAVSTVGIPVFTITNQATSKRVVTNNQVRAMRNFGLRYAYVRTYPVLA